MATDTPATHAAADTDHTAPTGPATPLTDVALAVLLALTPDQVAAADALWRHHAPRAFAGLLARDGFTWDDDAQRYVRSNGRPVDPDDVRHALLAFVAAIAWDLEREAERMARGEVTITDWRDTVAPVVRSTYVAGYALGAGGTAALTDADYAAIRARTADSAARLDRFAGLADQRDAAVGTVGAVVARTALYALPAYGLFEAGRAAGHEQAGFTVERSVLEPTAEHCSECADLAGVGWQPIGTVTLPGLRECGPGCRCWLEYGRDETADDDAASLTP